MLESLGSNPVVLVRAAGDEPGMPIILRRGEPAAEMRRLDRLFLLAGTHEFRLDGPEGEAAAGRDDTSATHSVKRPPPDAEEQPLQQRRAVAGGRDGGDGGEGHEGGGSLACGSSGAEGADGANGDGDDADDWGGRDLPLLVQPPKPGGFSGMEVLQRLAMSPEAQPAENIFLLTRDFVVGYDLYPKARVHLLILPRTRLDGPADLTASHLPLLRSMQRLARHLAASLRARTPGLPPFLCGFHAAPSLRQLHLHLLSSDLDSDALKNKKHFNSFATSFLLHPASVAAQIESSGKVLSRGHAAEEARALAPPPAPRGGTGRVRPRPAPVGGAKARYALPSHRRTAQKHAGRQSARGAPRVRRGGEGARWRRRHHRAMAGPQSSQRCESALKATQVGVFAERAARVAGREVGGQGILPQWVTRVRLSHA